MPASSVNENFDSNSPSADDAAAIRCPTLTLTRRLGAASQTNKKATKKTDPLPCEQNIKKREARKRPFSSIPIPSFQAERERLAKLFSDDSSDDDDNRKEKKKKSKKRSSSSTRRQIPIPDFTKCSPTTHMYSDDDDDALDLLLGDNKPVFAIKTRPVDATLRSSGAAAAAATNQSSRHGGDAKPTLGDRDQPKTTITAAGSIADNTERQEDNVPFETNNKTSEWTETEILSWAEKRARSGLEDPCAANQVLNMKHVYEALQKEMGAQAWSTMTVKLTTIKEHVLQRLGPPDEALFTAVDETYRAILAEDALATLTVKQVVERVQKNGFAMIPFSLATRKLIKKRLTDLINNQAPPVVAPDKKTTGDKASSTLRCGDDSIAVNGILSNKQPENDGLSRPVEGASKCAGVRPNAGNGSQQRDEREEAKLGAVNIFTTDQKKQDKVSSDAAMSSLLAADGPSPDLPKGSGLSCRLVDTPEVAVANKKQPRRRVQARKAVEKTNGETVDIATTVETAAVLKPAVQPRRGRKRKTNCQLCSNCPCSAMTESSSTGTLDLAQSDAAIERALIKHLQKVEKTAEHYDIQVDAVRRMLKKHRRDMWKKFEAAGRDDTEKPFRGTHQRFLPDAHELDESNAIYAAQGVSLSAHVTSVAQTKMFGVVPTVQPTLTQMFGQHKTGDLEGHGEAGKFALPYTIAEEEEEEEDEVDVMQHPLQAKSESTSNGFTEELRDGEKSDMEEGMETSNHEQIPYTRVEWKDGSEQLDPSLTSVWQSMLTGSYFSSIDTLFPGLCENDNGDNTASGMEDLVALFADPEAPDDADHQCSQSSAVVLSMLSQRGQKIAENMFEHVSADPAKLNALEDDCPRWRENVLYALHRRDGACAHDALKNVQDARARLMRAKAKMLKSIDQKAIVLGLFEEALQQSLARYPETEQEVYGSTSNNGFMPSQHLPKSPSRAGTESEICPAVLPGSPCPFETPVSVAS